VLLRYPIIQDFGVFREVTGEVVDARIVSLVKKLNSLSYFATNFSCAGYGPVATPKWRKKQFHKQSELLGAYLVAVFPQGMTPEALRMHSKFVGIFPRIEDLYGQTIYWALPLTAGKDMTERADQVRRYRTKLSRNDAFYRGELAKVKRVWHAAHQIVDEELRLCSEAMCESVTRPGRLSSTG